MAEADLHKQLVQVRVRFNGLSGQFQLVCARTGEVLREFGEVAAKAAKAAEQLKVTAENRRRSARISGELTARLDWAGILWPGEKSADWAEGEMWDDDDNDE